MNFAQLDFAPTARPPAALRLVVVSVLVVAACLAAGDLLVHAALGVWPGLRGYGHFRLSDYGPLTVLGVVAACIAWPAVLRLTSQPRWLFFRLAVVVTLALWLPDLYLLLRGEPPAAVGTLAAMHVAIALIAYNGLVRLAPPRRDAGLAAAPAVHYPEIESILKAALLALIAITCLEFALGICLFFLVPLGRGTGWVPHQNEALYLFHAGIGGILGFGTLAVLAFACQRRRKERFGMMLATLGIILAAVGGVLSEQHGVRNGGLVLMLLGAAIATFGYIAALTESAPRAARDDVVAVTSGEQRVP